MNRVSQLRFDEGAHLYTLEGAPVPNVTTILDGVGIGEIVGVNGAVLEAARARGTAVHAACADFDRGGLDITSYPQACFPYIEAYIKFTQDTGFEPTLIECKVLSEKYGYCGTLDRVGDLQGVETEIDLKTGSVGPAAGPQTAAYSEGADESYGIRPKRRFALVLNPGRYELVPLTDPNDWKIFMAALTVHHYKARTQ